MTNVLPPFRRRLKFQPAWFASVQLILVTQDTLLYIPSGVCLLIYSAWKISGPWPGIELASFGMIGATDDSDVIILSGSFAFDNLWCFKILPGFMLFITSTRDVGELPASHENSRKIKISSFLAFTVSLLEIFKNGQNQQFLFFTRQWRSMELVLVNNPHIRKYLTTKLSKWDTFSYFVSVNMFIKLGILRKLFWVSCISANTIKNGLSRLDSRSKKDPQLQMNLVNPVIDEGH